jgi:hypothetical protein
VRLRLVLGMDTLLDMVLRLCVALATVQRRSSKTQVIDRKKVSKLLDSVVSQPQFFFLENDSSH